MLNARKRETCPASDLVVGMQCGGSDAFSGVTANPALGLPRTLLVRAGATVMFSEVTEVRDAIHLLTPRAVNEQVATRSHPRDEVVRRLSRNGRRRSQRQYHAGQQEGGGLNNIVEKAFGSSAKSGSSAISGVLVAGRTRARRRADLCGDAGLRFCLRHAAARFAA